MHSYSKIFIINVMDDDNDNSYIIIELLSLLRPLSS